MGQWVESSFRGDAGYAEPGEAKIDRAVYAQALRNRRYGLENMLGLRYGMFHDVTTQAADHWATSTAFVAFLLDTRKQPVTYGKFLEYDVLAYNQTKGNSSSLCTPTTPEV